jgi:hypothetical protein
MAAIVAGHELKPGAHERSIDTCGRVSQTKSKMTPISTGKVSYAVLI